jgi:transcriptional regulator with XRE-family HTH domain
MDTSFALDLKVTRRKAGLAQEDLAHLLGVDKSTVSKIERGVRPIMLPELCALAFIYGKRTDQLLASLWSDTAADLAVRLQALPTPKSQWISAFNRQRTLKGLAERLASNSEQYGEI